MTVSIDSGFLFEKQNFFYFENLPYLQVIAARRWSATEMQAALCLVLTTQSKRRNFNIDDTLLLAK